MSRHTVTFESVIMRKGTCLVVVDYESEFD